MNACRLAAVALVCGVALILGGCSSSPIASSAVSANRAQEEAANKLLLLNIARAHERMPMHFSLMSQIRSGPGGWGIGVPGIGLQIPFGGAAEPAFSLSTSLEGQTPVDVTPLSSQEFMRGMTEPMKAEMLGFLVRQGWSATMLMYLAFESIEVVRGDAVLARIINDPRAQDFAKFESFVEAAALCDIIVDQDSAPPKFYSTVLTQVSAREAALAKQAELLLVPVDAQGAAVAHPSHAKQYRLATRAQDTVLRFRDRPDPRNDGTTCKGAPKIDLGNGVVAKTADSGMLESTKERRAQRKIEAAAGAASAQTELQFVMRSPQSMIYYLGELSRHQNDLAAKGTTHLMTIPDGWGGKTVLFQMSNRGDIATPAVSVDYAGQTFAVPKFGLVPQVQATDRSVSVLSLMVLIVGLQDKGLTAPGVSNVRLLR